MEDLIAHSENAQGREQPLVEHLSNVAESAGQFAAPFGADHAARLLGWFHDVGKVAEDVQAYLSSSDSQPHGPDHSSVGMLMAFEALEPLAFNAAGHHGGLPDRERLRERIQRKHNEGRIRRALERARTFLEEQRVSLKSPEVPEQLAGHGYEASRRAEFWIRMLHSALVDADALDAEAHVTPEKASVRTAEHSLADLWRCLERSQTQLMKNKTGLVNRMRAKVYEACLSTAEAPQGVFSLTVPTGGGKTLSGMAFALKHALRHGLRRVIVALPYTSIIEQNAKIYREIFGDTAVLEHHSSVGRTETPGDESLAEMWRRLASENWDAPIVVTTTVQLFESLFSNQNSRCRKLHNIVNSVLILDEVQTLPPDLLRPTLEVLQDLVDAYGVTLVLSTATQPALASREGFDGLREAYGIVEDPKQAFSALRRVSYELVHHEQWDWEHVADEVHEHPRVMVILNTITDALSLLDRLDRSDVLHLSTRLCAAHRRLVLEEVRRRLEREEPICLVSTQVVEAGVDIDFPVVFRAVGPLDRIIQAAGRCNREGRPKSGRVVVFEPADGHQPPGAYRTGTDVTRALFVENPDVDLADPELPLRYFRLLYDTRDLDKRGIQKLRERFQFEQTAKVYRLIEDDTIAAVVPFKGDDAAEERVGRLLTVAARGWANREDIRFFQPLFVNLRERVHREAVSAGLCVEIAPGLWEWRGKYDTVRGLELPGPPPPDSTIW